MATEAFVSGSYATKSYVDTKVSSSSGIAAYSYGQRGYIRYNDGLTIQWGTGKASSTTYFPTAFKNAVYTMVGSQNNWEQAASPIGFKNITLTSFRGTNQYCSDPFFFIAIGK